MRKLIVGSLALLLLLSLVLLATGGSGEVGLPTVRWQPDDELALSSEVVDPMAGGEGSTPPGERAVLAGDAERVEAILRGRIVEAGGVPVAGAKVFLSYGRGGRGGRGGGGRGRNQRGVPDPVSSGDDGTFAFVGQVYRNVAISLQVTHATHAPTFVDREVGDVRNEVDLGDIEMPIGGRVIGRVTDLIGNGVPVASVELIPGRGNRLARIRERRDVLPAIETDRNGFFRIPHLTPGSYSIEARARHKQEGRSPQFEIENEKEVALDDIRLGPGYEITGIVHARSGEPVARANVRLQSIGRGGSSFNARTDREGRFAIDHLPPSLLNLEVTARGHLDYEEYAVDPVNTPSMIVNLRDALRIRGLVVDLVTGQPVEAFAVRARRTGSLPDVREREQEERTQRTQEQLQAQMRDLRLQIEQAQGDPARLQELAQTFQQQLRAAGGGRGRRGQGADPTGTIPQEQVDEIRLLLGDEARSAARGQRQGGGGGGRGGRGFPGRQGFQGRADLTRLVGAGLAQRAMIPGDPGDEEPRPGGRFGITDLQEGIYVLDVGSSSHQRLRTEPFELRADQAEPYLEIGLQRGLTISGRILSRRTGEPVSGARIQLMQVVEEPPASAAATARPADQTNGRGGRRGRGGRGGRAAVATAMLEFASALNQADGPRGLRVLDTRSAGDGTFTIPHAPAGETYFLTAQASGHSRVRTEPFTLNADLPDLQLTMGSLAAIEGTVTGIPEGRSREVRAISFSGTVAAGGFGRAGGDRAPAGMRTARVAEDGTYRLENVEPGKYLVRAYLGDLGDFLAKHAGSMMQGGTLVHDLEVREGEVARHDLLLSSEPVGDVTGLVLHNGYPEPGFRVTLLRIDGAGPAGGAQGFGPGTETATSNDDGEFRIGDVATGEYRLTVTRGGGRRGRRGGGSLHEETVFVAAGTVNHFQVNVSTGSLQGAVQVDDETPAAELRGSVQLHAGATEVPETSSGGGVRRGRGGGGGGGRFIRIADGEFAAEDLATGPYLMVIDLEGREQTTEQIYIGGGAPTVVRPAAGRKIEAPAGSGGQTSGAGAAAPGAPGSGGRGTGRSGTGRRGR